MKALTPSAGLAALLVVLPFFVGCVSPNVLQDKEREIAQLRDQNVILKSAKRDLEAQLSSYEAQLLAAGTQLDQLQTLSQTGYDELVGMGLGIEHRGSALVISLPSEISFASGQADLSERGRQAVRAVANRLRSEFPNGIYWIEGHTDSDPIRRSPFKSNRDLSLARAMSVLRHMVEQSGISDEQCIVAGYGEYSPVAPNDTATNKARNRRVEIIVQKSRVGGAG